MLRVKTGKLKEVVGPTEDCALIVVLEIPPPHLAEMRPGQRLHNNPGGLILTLYPSGLAVLVEDLPPEHLPTS